MKTKICIITQCNLPVPAVSGGAVETLIEYLIEENEKNPQFYFTIITVDNDLSLESQKKYKYSKFIHINEKNKFINNVYNFIYRILKKINIYIPYSLESFDVLKFLKNNKNNYDYFLYEAGPTTQIKLLNKFIAKDKIITHLHWDGMGNDKISECFSVLLPVSKYIGSNWDNSCVKNHNTIIPFDNCIDLSLFEKKLSDYEKKLLKEQLNISMDNHTLLYIGRIVPEKGVLEMLEGIEKSSRNDIEVILVGSSNFGKKQITKYEKKVYEFSKKMTKKIHWIGFVNKEELYKYYNISDLLIMPSKFKEPAGLVCIEAQAYGIPLMVSNTGGLPEYVSSSTILLNADNLVEDISNSIDNFFKDYNQKTINNIIEIGKKNASKYDKSYYYKKFVEIIESLRR